MQLSQVHSIYEYVYLHKEKRKNRFSLLYIYTAANVKSLQTFLSFLFLPLSCSCTPEPYTYVHQQEYIESKVDNLDSLDQVLFLILRVLLRDIRENEALSLSLSSSSQESLGEEIDTVAFLSLSLSLSSRECGPPHLLLLEIAGAGGASSSNSTRDSLVGRPVISPLE